MHFTGTEINCLKRYTWPSKGALFVKKDDHKYSCNLNKKNFCFCVSSIQIFAQTITFDNTHDEIRH